MKEYKYGITKEIAEWAINRGLFSEDEILSFDEDDADLLIFDYKLHHNEKCMVYSKIVKNEATGKEMLDTVVGYLHENYDSAKAREEAEMNEDIMNMIID